MTKLLLFHQLYRIIWSYFTCCHRSVYTFPVIFPPADWTSFCLTTEATDAMLTNQSHVQLVYLLLTFPPPASISWVTWMPHRCLQEMAATWARAAATAFRRRLFICTAWSESVLTQTTQCITLPSNHSFHSFSLVKVQTSSRCTVWDLHMPPGVKRFRNKPTSH